jgi:hypothetical protein
MNAKHVQEGVVEDIRFSHPVILNLKTAHYRKVDSAYEAIEAMQDGWPGHPTGCRAYHKALRTCRDALDGWETASSCRREFVKAARNARIIAGS